MPWFISILLIVIWWVVDKFEFRARGSCCSVVARVESLNLHGRNYEKVLKGCLLFSRFKSTAHRMLPWRNMCYFMQIIMPRNDLWNYQWLFRGRTCWYYFLFSQTLRQLLITSAFPCNFVGGDLSGIVIIAIRAYSWITHLLQYTLSSNHLFAVAGFSE